MYVAGPILTLSWRVTQYCVVEYLNMLNILYYACSTEKTFLQDFLTKFIHLQIFFNLKHLIYISKKMYFITIT